MKKGISPVIATVLLVAITVLLGGLIFAFSKSALVSFSAPITCEDVSFDAGVFASQTDNPFEKEIEIVNKGNEEIIGLKIILIDEQKGSRTSIFKNQIVAVGGSESFILSIPSDGSVTDSPDNLNYLIVPLVEREGKQRECAEQYALAVYSSQSTTNQGASLTCMDSDNDEYSPSPNQACSNQQLDCDDSDPLINPAGIEICDGEDNNCDGQIDEGNCWMQQGLVAEWLFNEGTGLVVTDSSGNSNTGAIKGASWISDQSCKEGSCISFDGIDDYVSVSDSPTLNPTDAITIAGWVSPSKLNGGMFLSKGDNGAQYYFRLFANSVRFVIVTSAGTTTHERTVNLPLNILSHVAAVYDGTQAIIYVDGVALGAPTLVTGTITPKNFEMDIGKRSSSTNTINYFTGTIDNLRIWNRALSSQEIQALYNL